MSRTKYITYLLILEPLVSRGRIGRLKYLLLCLWAGWSLIPGILVLRLPTTWAETVGIALFLAGLFYNTAANLCLHIRRLHDIGCSGVLVLLAGIIWPFLLVWPGQPRDNRFGPRRSPKVMTGTELAHD